MRSIPIYNDTAAITCSISNDEVPDRIELVERMRHNLERIERTEHGVLLHFPNRADIDTDLHRFAVDEKRCCQFWGFAINATENQLSLRWDGPPAADDLVTRLVAYFRGDEPLTTISGLL